MSVPFISLCPLPQYSEHKMGYSPAAAATNSIVTGESPSLARGTAFLTLNALISTPCGPSADRTSNRTVSPSITSTVAGSNENRLATISNTFGSDTAGCCANPGSVANRTAIIVADGKSDDTLRNPGSNTRAFTHFFALIEIL